MASNLRIAILECDTPIDPVKRVRGTYGDVFTKFLKRSAAASGIDASLTISTWDVVTEMVYPRLEDVDGILLTGSKHNSFEDHDWILKLVQFVRDALDARIRIVGICFGHQILARALGSPVGRSELGWELSVDQVELNETGTKLFQQQKLAIHQMHRDIVKELPVGCENLGSSPRCGIQGLYAAGRLFAVQGHPEFDDFISSEIITARHSQKIIDDDLYESGMARVKQRHDGPTIGVVICRFFAGLID